MDKAYIDNHLLVADKPAGMPSQPDASGDVSLVDAAKDWLKREFAKPGNVYLALLHRLDRPTSGLVALARTEKAAGRMSEMFRRREVEKTYLAVVECHAKPEPEQCLEQRLARTGNGGVRVVRSEGGEAKWAKLRYRTLAVTNDGGRALLAVRLDTGVKHQIRAQLAHAGLPVAGDFRYGPFGDVARPTPVVEGKAILLHAGKLGFVHPVRREPLAVVAPPPDFWRPFLALFPDAVVADALGDAPWRR